LFSGARSGGFGRVSKIARTIADLQAEPILRSGSHFTNLGFHTPLWNNDFPSCTPPSADKANFTLVFQFRENLLKDLTELAGALEFYEGCNHKELWIVSHLFGRYLVFLN